MAPARPHKPHQPHTDVPDEPEPGLPPVEPDKGPVPDLIPDDPENDRVIGPGSSLARPVGRQPEVARCP